MREGHVFAQILAAVVVAGALVFAEPATASAVQIRSHGPRSDKVVALTIDDGWSPKACRAMFEILERRHIPATFFPAGEAMAADRGLWREIAARGYPIGNHTAHHTHLAGKSVAVQLEAIRSGRAWIKSITGRAAIRVLRPPAAEWDGNTVVAASRAGERLLLLWDHSFGDTALRPVEARLIRNATRGHAGSVLLMHCNRPISASVLERVINSYLERGFTFVTVPQLFGLPGPVPVYPEDVPPIIVWRQCAIGHMAWSLDG